MERLMTIGYEKTSLDDFIAALKDAGVTTLLDIREIPISRRKGFSKRTLCEAVEAAGITYRHERELGSPKDIRQRLYANGDYAQFFASFKTYLKSQKALLGALARELRGGVALMCYERDPSTCHRSVVARHFEYLTSLSVTHIEVASGDTEKGAGARSGEGISAA
jgi:uncharacterized protein (DUF488 family)